MWASASEESGRVRREGMKKGDRERLADRRREKGREGFQPALPTRSQAGRSTNF